jgi:arabinose-5-phosphate isomerase
MSRPGSIAPTPLPHAVEVPATPLTGPAAEAAFARRLLAAEARAITALASGIGPAFHKAVELIVHCAETRGTVLVSGLGKSGLIGQKLSATLASLGIPSHFVHPAEAAHGDLGRFRTHDIGILISNSGSTAETINLAALLHQDGIALIGICAGTPDCSSPLERLCDPVLCLGPEAGGTDADFSPAPTCSTTATLALGDALALCAARRRGFSDDDFARRHPGGHLGEMLRPVTDILRFVVGRNIVPVRDDQPVRAALAAADAANQRRPGAMLLVGSDGRLTGIFTDADLRRLIERDITDLDRPISSLMTRSPQVLPAAARVRDAVQLVRESRRDELPVVDDLGRPVGILDVQDLVALRLVQND